MRLPYNGLFFIGLTNHIPDVERNCPDAGCDVFQSWTLNVEHLSLGVERAS